MLRSFVILLIVTTNLCTFLDSYKIANGKDSRTIDASDQQDSDLEDGYAEGLNYSNEEESYKQSSGRVVIGKWRNNGEAFEPKWRDGDSVPLAPFSTMSFNSGWKRKGPDSREDYQIEPDTFYTGSIRKNDDFHNVESYTADKNENENYNGVKLVQETERNVGFKDTNRDRQDKPSETLSSDRRNGSGVKYRETLQSYPNEYELFENENDDPRPRKRRPPENYEFPTTNEKRLEVENGEEPRRNQTRIDENVELKTFLKTQGSGLSLSEILQQKNLTLADILKGKPNAIKLLKSNDKVPDGIMPIATTEAPEKITPNSSTSGYPRWSQSIKNIVIKPGIIGVDNENESIVDSTTSSSMMMKIDNTRTENTVDKIVPASSTELTDNETSLSDKFDLRNDRSHQEENKPEDLKHEFLKPLEENRESLFIEATSNDGRFTPVNNDDEDDDDEIMEFSDYPLKMNKFVPPVMYDTKRKSISYGAIRASTPLADDIDSKLSIENIMSSDKKYDKIIVNETVSDVESNPNEKYGEIEVTRNETELGRREDGKKSDNEDIGKMLNYSTTENHKESNSDDKNFTLNQKVHEVVIPKVDPQSRAEILELFSSGSSAERLERLLASRNMTIEELIALRQRGSSQVHFAEVFKTKELQTSTSQQRSKGTEPKNGTNIENGAKQTRKETFGKYISTDLFDQLSRNKNFRPDISSLNKNSELNPDEKETEKDSGLTTLPAVNNIQRDSEGSSYYTSIETVRVPVVVNEVDKIPGIFDENKPNLVGASLSEIGRVEEIINNDLKSLKTGYGTNDYEYSEKKQQSSNKVKPSIIASGGILGVTIVVFLAIFIACRIRQKKKKFTYKNSFAKAVFHNPVMTPRKLSNTSSVNTIMVDVVATSTAKRPHNHDPYQCGNFDMDQSEIDNDSLDANDSWDTIPDFMK